MTCFGEGWGPPVADLGGPRSQPGVPGDGTSRELARPCRFNSGGNGTGPSSSSGPLPDNLVTIGLDHRAVTADRRPSGAGPVRSHRVGLAGLVRRRHGDLSLFCHGVAFLVRVSIGASWSRAAAGRPERTGRLPAVARLGYWSAP